MVAHLFDRTEMKMERKNLTVGELIALLSKFPEDMEVELTDGHECVGYNTADIEIAMFTDEDRDETFVDIGIGGCQLDHFRG